jgi:methyltransferase (TIGR00027 family)
MSKQAARTGAGPTALVAIEQYFPEGERILDDALAYQMLPFLVRVFVWSMRSRRFRSWMVRATEKDTPGIWNGMMCRKRYIDEKLIDSIRHIEAVVNLGTGFDTRAYRLPALSSAPVWEVDQFENIKSKQTRLRKIFETVPSHVRLVAMDFDRESIGAALESSEYTSSKRAFFVWEAVTQYLTERGIRATFDFLAKAASGSRLAFTYVRKDFLDGRVMYGWEKGYKQFVKSGLWLFGMEPEGWPDFLKEYGWRVVEDVGYDEMAEKYVKPTGRALATMPIERMVYAEKA